MTGYYRLLGKRVVLTVHNVNQGKRDANDSSLNRLTLKAQYRQVDHLFVHTDKMKHELLDEFGVADDAVTVLKHPINDAFPDTELTPLEAKLRLGIDEGSKTLLFLGRIRPYKGLEYLVEAFDALVKKDGSYRLIIAGEPKKGEEELFCEGPPRHRTAHVCPADCAGGPVYRRRRDGTVLEGGRRAGLFHTRVFRRAASCSWRSPSGCRQLRRMLDRFGKSSLTVGRVSSADRWILATWRERSHGFPRQ